MAGEDQEKTEEATPKKIEDAKKDGNVPKSQDLAGFVTLCKVASYDTSSLYLRSDRWCHRKCNAVWIYLYHKAYNAKFWQDKSTKGTKKFILDEKSDRQH